MASSEQSGAGEQAAWFASTHWTVVLSAAGEDSPQAAEALETLCRTYWYPLYAYLRRRGRDAHEAQDLTQGFLAQFLASHGLASVGRHKGRFRCFLLSCLNHYLANERDRVRAAKRGGAVPTLSLDQGAAEGRYALEPATEVTPEKLYERQWALTLLERVLDRLQAEFVAAGKARQFECLKEFLDNEGEGRPYAEVGAALGLKPTAVAAAVYRFRQRYRELLRQEIAQTVSGPGDLEAELRWLIGAVS